MNHRPAKLDDARERAASTSATWKYGSDQRSPGPGPRWCTLVGAGDEALGIVQVAERRPIADEHWPGLE